VKRKTLRSKFLKEPELGLKLSLAESGKDDESFLEFTARTFLYELDHQSKKVNWPLLEILIEDFIGTFYWAAKNRCGDVFRNLADLVERDHWEPVDKVRAAAVLLAFDQESGLERSINEQMRLAGFQGDARRWKRIRKEAGYRPRPAGSRYKKRVVK